MVNQNSRKDSLTILRNNMLLEVTISEVNLRLLEKARFASADLNPNLSGQIEGEKAKIAHIHNSIKVVDSMIDEEAKKVN